MTDLKLDIKEINSKLEIIRLTGRLIFTSPTKKNERYAPEGFCFHVANKGYIGFIEDKPVPYIPCGGRYALESILEQGGFNSFDGIHFVNPDNGV
jgi:hypothetical protein